MRPLGFERLELQSGEWRDVMLTADPRLLGRFDPSVDQWWISKGGYSVAVSESAVTPS
jgi:beta-glucosidase